MPKKFRLVPMCAASSWLLLAGCVAPPEPPEILVSTTPPGADCILSRLGALIATAAPTPAIAIVPPANAPLTVTCRRHGFADAAVTLPPRPTGPGFATTLYDTPPYTYEHRVDIALAPAPR